MADRASLKQEQPNQHTGQSNDYKSVQMTHIGRPSSRWREVQDQGELADRQKQQIEERSRQKPTKDKAISKTERDADKGSTPIRRQNNDRQQLESEVKKNKEDYKEPPKQRKRKVNANFLVQLITGNRQTNQRLDQQDITNAGEKLKSSFQQSRRPITMSQFLNQKNKESILNDDDYKVYKCSVVSCQRQFSTLLEYESHKQKHKKQ